MDDGHVPVYVDATTLIGLARIDRLDLLSLLPMPIRVTSYVWAEATDLPTRPGAQQLLAARTAGLLQVVEEGDVDAYPYLDQGESTVLSAAASAGAGLLVDERKARRYLHTDANLRDRIAWSSGLLGLLLVAKRRGTIPHVRPILDQLSSQRFHVNPALRTLVLEQAGESSIDE